MIFKETKLKGAYIVDINPIEDERGFFARGYCQKEFAAHQLISTVVQTNFSFNKKKGTLRGLHLQAAPYAEAKLVRCTRGAIYDVIVDMREDSETFTHWIGVELTAENYRMLYVPEGFAHGFISLEDHTDVCYQVSQFYTPGHERGYRWDDPVFGIQWPINPVVISEKDQAHALFQWNKNL
ncbi:dTDP-4-dehydrorhamnose 3,5-epimerase [Parapedobacter sp. ISTM3]|uniref:dTDP-4-dehydrorhamnose 3,5-epimerase n=1 Tax=Parapedobacter luteus TaxID=623280 RepID=A0A1T5A775_9SPHI|nr:MULTISPECIES: dTDP-4-dehydrorhamnose 3,5-epimerase [Parapedobacter]MBK1442218.1 dTDP-4-dehydrorhamnose 3,5-epimerase [Parapedobacter sp. ISTM3]SKB30709.1 dTDP-4-dehydrorhamnose 3,5-epimerase [Parapedobacter luteus]